MRRGTLSVLALLLILVLGCQPAPPAAPTAAPPVTGKPAAPTAAAPAPVSAATPAAPAAPAQPTAQPATAAAKSMDRLVISQVTDANGLPSVNPIDRLHTLLPRNFIYDQLLTRDQSGIKPMLAESVQATDPTHYRIVLRRGVKFHNGELLDAASVKASFDFLATAPETGLFHRYFVGYKESTVVDDHTVDMVLSAPNVLVPAGLTQVPIFPASQMTNNPVQQLADRKLIGTGPYKLASFSPNESVTLAAFDDYWGGKPPFREVVLKNVPEASTRIAELQAGTTQIVGDVPSRKIAEIERIPGAKIVTEPGIRSAYIIMSPKLAPLNNAKVRQAIYYAVDRKALTTALFDKYADPAVSPAHTRSAGSVPAFPLEDFSPDKAKALLKEAGVTTPLTLDLDVAPVYVDVAQVLQAQLKAVGINVTINSIEATATLTQAKRLDAKTTPTMVMNVGLDNIELDSYFTMYAYVGRPDGFANGLGYPAWPAFDDLMTRYLAASDQAARTDLAKQALEVVKAEMPIVWLYHPQRVYAVAGSVEYTPRGDGQLRLQDVRPK